MRICTSIIGLIIVTNGFCQIFDKNIEIREILATTDSSFIIAQINNESKKIKTRTDLYYHWYKGGEIFINRGDYFGNFLHGEYCEFSSGKKMMVKGVFFEGLKDGEWKEWYENGNLKRITNYKNGLLNGIVIEYSNNGQTLSSINYKSGLIHGEMLIHQKDSTLKVEFKNGNEITKKNKKKTLKMGIISKIKLKQKEKKNTKQITKKNG